MICEASPRTVAPEPTHEACLPQRVLCGAQAYRPTGPSPGCVPPAPQFEGLLHIQTAALPLQTLTRPDSGVPSP